eukprot:TRINITY_DN18793_c0_g1_i1.p1 TRINITY_DN18793_c0_g1~~TRINITY_DN18793_c0_g1_i1.p1  ORF type:complete len:582 (-),score=180.12 TRINITY_DN18793_c0_g1_i1:730-2475(-)
MNVNYLEVKEVRSRAHRRGKSAGSRFELEMDPLASQMASLDMQSKPGNLANFHTFKLESPLEERDVSWDVNPSPAGISSPAVYFTNRDTSKDDLAKAMERLLKLVPQVNAPVAEEINGVVEILRRVQARNIEDQVENLERATIVEMLSGSSKNSSMTQAELVVEWLSKNFASSAVGDESGSISSVPEIHLAKSATEVAPRKASAAIIEMRLKSADISSGAGNLDEKSSAIALEFSDKFKLNSVQLKLLLQCNEWGFDVFELNKISGGKPLSLLMGYLYHTLKFDKLKVDEIIFQSFVSVVENGYNDVPYHNKIHAADVVQGMLFFIAKSSLSDLISEEDVFAALIAAAVHDLGHRGMNNNFEVESESGLAIRYNDQSVMENHHAASAFRFMQVPDLNIMNNWSRKQRKTFRDVVVKMVLGTDMKTHFHHVATLQSAVETHKRAGTWFDFKNAKDRELLMVCGLHAADISNPCKPAELSQQWTLRIEEEWFIQGDAEKALGLPISPMMDRSHPNTADSQVGFINYIVQPFYKALASAVEGIDVCLSGLESNLNYWKQKNADKKAASARTPVAASPAADDVKQ